jgi:hypothetical protein
VNRDVGGAGLHARRAGDDRDHQRDLPLAGFMIGLTFTLRGGDPIDVADHVTTLVVLFLTVVLVVPVALAADGRRGVKPFSGESVWLR